MLLGENWHTLDNKNRVSVPASMRGDLGNDFMVVRSLREKCLRLFSQDAWKKYIEPLEHKERKVAEPILWYFYHDAMQSTPDSLGRIRISKELLSFIGMNPDETGNRATEMVIVGCGNYAEIWSSEMYTKYAAEKEKEVQDHALEESGY